MEGKNLGSTLGWGIINLFKKECLSVTGSFSHLDFLHTAVLACVGHIYIRLQQPSGRLQTKCLFQSPLRLAFFRNNPAKCPIFLIFSFSYFSCFSHFLVFLIFLFFSFSYLTNCVAAAGRSVSAGSPARKVINPKQTMIMDNGQTMIMNNGNDPPLER